MAKICTKCGKGANDFEVVCSKCAGTAFRKEAAPEAKVAVRAEPKAPAVEKQAEPVTDKKEKPAKKRR